MMLEHLFRRVYTKFKLNFYRSIFSRFETREASLTAVETFCVEVIHALRTPTISEFAKFVDISLPNATHKIQSLIRKKYVTKEQSPHDKRESILRVTDRFYQLYNISDAYIDTVMERIRQRFSPEEITMLEKILKVMETELMPETLLPAD
ncbi:MAG: MarR family winged helix-turn-helix transcriptional regulator [Christensenellales bacterium]